MQCPSCGATIAEHSRFCPHCGVAIVDSGDTSDAERPADREASTTGDGREASAVGRTPVAPGLRSCPACGADNSQRRTNCGRCGARLTDGEPSRASDAGKPEAADAELDEEGVDDDRGGRRRVRPWVLVVALAALIGTAVGAAVFARYGGDASGEAPTFDPTVYREAPGPLDVAEVSASSTLPAEGSIRYEPRLVSDDDPTTAWNDGVDERAGIGEELVLSLPEPAWINRASFRNGYQKDERTFFDNARVKALRVDFDDGSSYELRLADRPGIQTVELPIPALTRAVRFEILSVYRGDRYDDLAISEIDLRGWEARGRDREALEPSS